MDSEEERKTKQTYLRKVIIEAGYNPDGFVNYLNSVKEDGSEIDNWTLDELKIEVQNYKRYYQGNDDQGLDSKLITNNDGSLNNQSVIMFGLPGKEDDSDQEDGTKDNPFSENKEVQSNILLEVIEDSEKNTGEDGKKLQESESVDSNLSEKYEIVNETEFEKNSPEETKHKKSPQTKKQLLKVGKPKETSGNTTLKVLLIIRTHSQD